MRHVFYIVFGLGVVGVYALLATSGFDLGAGGGTRSVLPPEYRGGGYRTAAPLIWHTGFHGPAAPGDDDSSGGGVVFVGGGYGGGK